MPAKNPPIRPAYEVLFAQFGKQHWWPAETRTEMILGAILTQNTAWTNVEKALANLRSQQALTLDVLRKTPLEQVAEWIRPAGYFNQKAGYIKRLAKTIFDRFDGSLDRLFALDTHSLREELLSWKGVGPETADSIILYAGKRPVFVVDAYTRRICLRHGWIGEKATYDDIAQLFTRPLPADAQLFNEYHALIVRICKAHCTAKKPTCATCPLQRFL
jgi:endonuclease-3 related protein